MLGIWDEETAADEYKQEELDTAALIKDARFGASDKSPDWLGEAETPREKWEKGQVTANESYQNIINNADQAYEDELTTQQAGIDAHNAKIDAVNDTIAAADMDTPEGVSTVVAGSVPKEDDITGVGGVNTMKKKVVKGVLDGNGNIKSPASIRKMGLELYEAADKLENLKPSERDWGPAMMQFGLTLMSTPGSFLNAVGIAGKEALKTWKDIKKGDKDAAQAKRELALKYAKLADTKDTAASEDKTIPLYSINEEGKLVETTTKRPSTEGEASNMRLSNMSNLIMSGKVEKLSEADTAKLARHYQGILGEYMKDNFKTGEREWKSGMENPTTVYKKLLARFPNNKAIQSASDAWNKETPIGKQKLDYMQKKIATWGLLDNVEDYHKDIDAMSGKAPGWYGALYTKVEGVLTPFFSDPETNYEEGSTQSSVEQQAKATFALITKINPDDSNISKQHTQMFTMAYGLARQIMKVGYDEQGKSLSDKDMDFAMRMIAPGFGTSATKTTMRASIDTAMRSMTNTQFRKYHGLFGPSKNSEVMKTEYLNTFEKNHAQYLAKIHGKDWYDALPDRYKDTASGTPPPPPPDDTGTPMFTSIDKKTTFSNAKDTMFKLQSMVPTLRAQNKGSGLSDTALVKQYIKDNFSAADGLKILKIMKGVK
jgi:hypothetical protein